MLDIAANRTRGHESLLGDLRRLARHTAVLDEDGSFPSQDIARLATIGALTAPFGTSDTAGIAIGAPDELAEVLRLIGHGGLPLGRIYEGHVNAAALIIRYGTPEQIRRARRRAAEGALFGVWNTEGADGVRLVREGDGLRLVGSKTFASGAGHVACPLITARDAEGAWRMVLPRLDDAGRADLSDWRAHGMRASATGSFRFTGLAVADEDLLGGAGDYHRQPHFSAGAWRFCAVQLGGIERLIDEAKDFLHANGRHEDPHQLARMGEALIAAETARLWVGQAARLAEAAEVADTPEAVERAVAYVNLARSAVERSGLETLERVQRSVGLAGFLRTHPLERLCRDLATYLRQPAPDRALCAGAAHAFRDESTGDLWR